MKIAVIGSGSIGLYYGTKLVVAGEDVQFLMRSGFDLAKREGIRVRSQDGNLHVASPSVAQSPEEIGPVDLVMISVKVTDNPVLSRMVPPLLGPDTMLLTLQNGLGNEDFLAAHFGPERVLGGLCFVCLTRDSPVSVEHFGHGTLSLGEFQSGGVTPRLQAVAARFAKAGVETRTVDHLITERWRKLVWNIPFNGLSVAAGGVAVDQILADTGLHAECRALMAEVIATATALGHPIPEDFGQVQIDRTYPMGAYQPSTMVDFLAGRPLEIEAIWGEPLRRARSAGIAVPHLSALYEKLVQAAQKSGDRA
jgi:2-dehydropantoate 2-reductase